MSEYQVHLIDINSSVVISLERPGEAKGPSVTSPLKKRGSLGANDNTNLAC